MKKSFEPPKFDLLHLIQYTGTISGAMEVLVGAVAALLRLRIKPGVDLNEALDALKEDIAAAFNDLPPPPPRGEPSS